MGAGASAPTTYVAPSAMVAPPVQTYAAPAQYEVGCYSPAAAVYSPRASYSMSVPAAAPVATYAAPVATYAAPAAGALFNALDRNHDGVITRAEMAGATV